MEIRLRYVVAKHKRGGRKGDRTFHYWQRKGFPPRRLPDDPNSSAFVALVTRLNQEADEEIDGRKEPEVYSLSWLVEKYFASPDAPANARTRKNYRYFLGRLERKFGACDVTELDREMVFDIRDFFAPTPSLANQIIETLRTLLSWAVDRTILEENPALKPRRITVNPRQVVWTVDQEQAFLAHADATMKLAFMLGAYTAQRLGDICAMTWSQYDGATIKLRQQKTGVLLEVPCHRDLRAALDAAERRSLMILTTPSGKPFRPSNFNLLWKKVAKKADIHGQAQFRDLRRTAIVRLGEAGANAIQISAISGHEIGDTQRILEVYLPRNVAMGRAAILKMERSKP